MHLTATRSRLTPNRAIALSRPSADPRLRRAVQLLYAAAHALDRLDNAHGPRCHCSVCTDANHAAYMARTFADLLGGAALDPPDEDDVARLAEDVAALLDR